MSLAGDLSCDEPPMLRSDAAKAAALLAEVSEATQDRHERQLVDAHTCLEVFISNWQQALNIMESSTGVNEDDVDPAFAYLGQMMTLLGEERAQEDGQPGSILAYACKADIFNRMLSWTTDCCQGNGRLVERIKLQLLSLYELLVMNQSRQALLFSQVKPDFENSAPAILDPMVKLLSLCGMRSSVMVERRLVLLLHHLCVMLTQRIEGFEVCEGAPFVIISLLIPFVHREGEIGEMARDSLLLIMALSARNYSVGEYIAVSSDFCPVLATGLSALFSSLPRKLNLPTDDCFQIFEAEAMQIPNLLVFLDALEFCDAVVEVSHPMVKENLLHFVCTGFLQPVMGSALHQNCIEETITATVYLDLFLRRLAQGSMLRIFLKFIITGYYDHYCVLDSLISRINAGTKLSLVTLSLFQTILDFHVEDVMFQLILRYLIPLNHLMWSQRRSLCDVEAFGRSVDRFLCLVPSACLPEAALQGPLLTSVAASSPISAPAAPPLGLLAQRRASAVSPATAAQQLAAMSTSYEEYLLTGGADIRAREIACLDWNFPYDGCSPPSNIFRRYEEPSNAFTGRSTFSRLLQRSQSGPCSSKALLGGTGRSNPTSGRQISNKGARRPSTLDLHDVCSPAGLICSPEFSQTKTIYQLSFSGEDIDRYGLLGLRSASPNPPEEESLLERVVRLAMSTDFDAFIEALDEVATPEEEEEEGEKEMGQDSSRLEALLTSLTEPTEAAAEEDEQSGRRDEEEAEQERYDGVPRRVNLPELSTADDPTVGPFLTALLTRLETMPNSCLAINLVLTGIFSSLASYPQPLLRSYLLNTALVLQPSVRSLYQVLFALRHRVDCFSYSVARFESHLVQAREAMRRRTESACPCERAAKLSATATTGAKPATTFVPLLEETPPPLNGCADAGGRRYSGVGRAAFLDIFSRRRRKQKKISNAFEESYLASLKLKNMVYCAVVMEEFCKELAALCQEHSVRP